VALITALQPLLTGALAGLVVGEPTGAKAWVGLSLGFIGVGLVVGFRLEPQIAWGYLIPFGSAFAMTIASLLKRYWAKSKKQNLLEMVPSLFIQSLSTSLFVLFPAWYIEGLETKWTLPFISTLFWLSIVVSFAAYWCLWRLYEKKQATQVASLFYLSPPVTMVMAWICFGDRIMWSDLCGLLVGAAGVLFVYKEKRPYAVKSK
jgi:drug/metabolite transporter (DMT)-like permease